MCMWLFISMCEGIMKKGIVKSRIQIGTFNSISVGVEVVLSVLGLITTSKFGLFCSCFNEIKKTDVSKLFSISFVIWFVNYCSFKSTVSGPDGLLLMVQQIPINTFCFMLSPCLPHPCVFFWYSAVVPLAWSLYGGR